MHYMGVHPDGTKAAIAAAANQVIREFSLLDGSHIGPQLVPSNSGNGGISAVSYTPEPGTLALMAVGGLMVLRRRRRV